jgi:hypothetical protein
MEKLVVEGTGWRVCHLKLVTGDLRLMGRVTGPLEVRADRREDIELGEQDEAVEITCRSNCILYIPRDMRVEIGRVGGDARITDLRGDLLLRAVGGDVNLRNLQMAALESVGGDLGARRIRGHLSADQVGGDAKVHDVQGDLRLRAVGGDVSIAQAGGEVSVSAGGDIRLRVTTPPLQAISLRSGGDMLCWLPQGSSVQVQATAGGTLDLPGRPPQSPGTGALQWNEGRVPLELSAGGDLRLVLIGADEAETGGAMEGISRDIGAQVVAEIESSMASVEFAGLDSEWIEEKVRRAMHRARRKLEAARKRGRRERRVEVSATLRGTGGRRPAAALEQERLAILRMLEEGHLNVEQAEELLQALEGAE